MGNLGGEWGLVLSAGVAQEDRKVADIAEPAAYLMKFLRLRELLAAVIGIP